MEEGQRCDHSRGERDRAWSFRRAAKVCYSRLPQTNQGLQTVARALDRKEIEDILPHRPPFLFVDSVSDFEPGRCITGNFEVKSSGLCLQEDNGTAFLPNTILVEAMAQVGAILVLHPEENRGRTIFFRAIQDTEFHARIPAGGRVRVEASVRRLRARFGSLTVSAYLDEQLAAQGTMSFALA